MSRFADLLDELRHEHQQEVALLQLVIDVLVVVQPLAEKASFSAIEYEFRQKQMEALRLARLYGDEAGLGGVSVDAVIARLSEALDESRDHPGIPGWMAEDPEYLQARLDEAIFREDEVDIRRFTDRLHATKGPS